MKQDWDTDMKCTSTYLLMYLACVCPCNSYITLQFPTFLTFGAHAHMRMIFGHLLTTHADDIQTLANNSSSMEAQIATVIRFANDNFLTLNASKCEIVVFEKLVGKTHRNIDIDFPMKNEGKCLGYTWSSNLSSLPMIKEQIQKAR